MGEGVEIGTHRADFANIMLSSWPGILYCIDPWGVPTGYEGQVGYLGGGSLRGGMEDIYAIREDDYRCALDLLTPHGARARILRCLSLEAVGKFQDGTLDMVYIDGDHREEAVRDDLLHWWPKLRPYGILAGHDFIMPGEAQGGWGRYVQPAVLDAAAEHGVNIYLIAEEAGEPWSYYMIKPGPQKEGDDL